MQADKANAELQIENCKLKIANCQTIMVPSYPFPSIFNFQFSIFNLQLIAFLVILSSCHLVTLSPCLAGQAATPTFAIHTASGRAATGPLQLLGAGWSVQIGGTEALQVPEGDLVSLRCAGQTFARVPLERADHFRQR